MEKISNIKPGGALEPSLPAPDLGGTPLTPPHLQREYSHIAKGGVDALSTEPLSPSRRIAVAARKNSHLLCRGSVGGPRPGRGVALGAPEEGAP